MQILSHCFDQTKEVDALYTVFFVASDHVHVPMSPTPSFDYSMCASALHEALAFD
jgi:hypothetical protein